MQKLLIRFSFGGASFECKTGRSGGSNPRRGHQSRGPIPSGGLIGYAGCRQRTRAPIQLNELRAATKACSCSTVGADLTRRVLARLLREIQASETPVVVRLDRLVRSISHLLAEYVLWNRGLRVAAALLGDNSRRPTDRVWTPRIEVWTPRIRNRQRPARPPLISRRNPTYP